MFFRRLSLVYSLRSRRVTSTNCNIIKIIPVPKKRFCTNTNNQSSFNNFPNLEDKKIEILENALAQVSTLGWSYEALALGAQKIGLPNTTHGIISNVNQLFVVLL